MGKPTKIERAHAHRLARRFRISDAAAVRVIEGLRELCVVKDGVRPRYGDILAVVDSALSQPPKAKRPSKKRAGWTRGTDGKRVGVPAYARSTGPAVEDAGGDASERAVRSWKLNLDHSTGRRDGLR